MKDKIFPRHLLNLILFIAVLNMLANMFSWYWRIEWFDMFMHFISGVWVGLTALWFFSSKNYFKVMVLKIIPSRIFLISLVSVLLIGLAWEAFEFGVNASIIFSDQNNIIDTLSDLIFDLIGAIVAGIYYIKIGEFK